MDVRAAEEVIKALTIGQGDLERRFNAALDPPIPRDTLTASTTATVHNVSPFGSFSVIPYQPTNGPRFQLNGSLSDLGIADVHSVSINWGDGMSPTVLQNVTSSFSAIHTYPLDGQTYTAQVTIADDDTGQWGGVQNVVAKYLGVTGYAVDWRDIDDTWIPVPSDEAFWADEAHRWTASLDNPADGAFVIAQDLYEGDTDQGAGYDVHAYDEDFPGEAFAEVWDAIRRRGIEQISIIGYSQGGGATYHLSELLAANADTNPVPIDYTAYIDGIRWGGVFGEDRKPVDSNFHVNYRQELELPSGSPTPGVNVNVTDTAWGAALTHTTIDTDVRVMTRIIEGFAGPAGAGEVVHDGLTDIIVP